ncbi:hypothetical protein WN55_08617 [Dufourea novaeangliae]|uniref:Uncharacterized protein n=1 Tax=Dufourea novaeangliae TaxID=178035 RepID=A0A154PSZ1_DUFNO|nr:hypothetical protein WN55_08617 [Dufourea novaeangliae]
MASSSSNITKRRLSLEGDCKNNAAVELGARMKYNKAPKLHSLQLNKLYKSLLTKHNVNNKSKVQPNLSVERKKDTGAPPVGASSKQIEQQDVAVATTSNNWEIPKETKKIISSVTASADKNHEKNKFHLLLDDSDMELDENVAAAQPEKREYAGRVPAAGGGYALRLETAYNSKIESGTSEDLNVTHVGLGLSPAWGARLDRVFAARGDTSVSSAAANFGEVGGPGLVKSTHTTSTWCPLGPLVTSVAKGANGVCGSFEEVYR